MSSNMLMQQQVNGVKFGKSNCMSADNVPDKCHRSVSDGGYSSGGKKRSLEDAMGGVIDCNQPHMHETKKYHRMIEKRRRDRINECIYQLKDLLPRDMLKTTGKPMEKAVILELVVQYMQMLAKKRECENENDKSPDFIEGFRSCHVKMFTYLESMIDEHQKESLLQQFQDEMPKEYLNSKPMTPERESAEIDTGVSEMQTTESNAGSSAGRNWENSSSNQEYVMSASSSSSSGSPSSELSMCTDNSDSSSSNNAYNERARGPKRKVFHHHHRSSTYVSSQSKHQASRTADDTITAVSSATQAQMPVFVNMPFVMNPGMVSQPQVAGGDANRNDDVSANSTPCLVKPTAMQVPGGMVMPQMTSDMNCGIQFPMFLVAQAPMQQIDQQVNHGQPKTQMQSGPQMMFQPTMMMPVQDQRNFICMPSFPMMPQFQSAPVMPVQSPVAEVK